MKKQIKKSLSLFLAVLMLMTCWVWVVPQKAEAGEITQYYMKITTNVTDTGNEDGSKITINYRDTNGTGDTGTFTQEYAQQEWEGPVTVYEGPINGWPTSFSWQFDLGGGRTENHRDITVWIGGSAETCTHQIAYSTGYNFVNDLTGSDNLNCTLSITGTAPYFNEVTSIEAGSATVNKLINGADAATTVKVTGGKDQYGVVWKAALPTSGFSYSFKYTNASGSEQTLGTSYVSTSSTSNSATVYVKNAVQKLFPGAANGNIQAYCTYNNTTASASIKADFPTYKATFDSNGGLIGDDSSSTKTQVELAGDRMHYDSVIGKQPAYAAKDGFEFKGFYSTKNADATGKTASFSGTKFEDNVTKVPDTGDTTWYAAWHAKPVTATFVTQDGQMIGELEGRYNNYLTASNMYNGDAGLNAAVKAAYTGNGIQFDSNNAPIYKDGATTYNFAGWKIIKGYDESVVDGDKDTVLKGDVTFQATYTKADTATYTVKFKNAEGAVVSEKSGYKYRDDVTNIPANDPTKATDDKYEYVFIGWARDIGKSFYSVDETDRDENGATVVYTHKDGASFVVKGDASYVPVFRMIPREYSVTFNYTVDGGETQSVKVDGYHWHDGIEMPESIKNNYTYDGFRYYIDGWTVGTNSTKVQLDDIVVEGDMNLTATYGAGEAAKYTINFYGKDEDGVTDIHLNADSNIYEHNTTVKAPEISQTIDTDEALYTFVAFKDKNGNTYSQTATADVDYYAEYTEKVYADVTFYNEGVEIYKLAGKENGIFIGDKIPAYDVETYKTPEKAEDAVGTYTFSGWADGNGNAVVPGEDTFTGDIYLHAQYTTNYKDYTVIFKNDDGTELSKKTYHYGDEIEIPADPTKAEDESYIYDFRAWDPDVSEVCYGDATYTASYRRSQKTYPVVWMKDDKSVANTVNYHYGERILTPGTPDPIAAGEPSAGYTWILNEWIRCNADGQPIDADGNVVAEDAAERYVRGIQMGATPIYFYPTYKKEALVHTVKFYNEDGTTLIGTAQIPHDESIADYDDEFIDGAIKEATPTQHFIFANWVKLDGAAIDKITGDVEVKATYTAEAHNKKIYEIVKAPTCTETGLVNMKCEADSCGLIDYNVVEPVISDSSAPVGQVQLGSNVWKLEDYSSINYDDVVYVGPSTKGVISATDTNAPSEPWNLDGKITRRVGKIEYYVSKEVVAAPSTIPTWETAYDYDSIYAGVLESAIINGGLTRAQFDALDEDDATKKEILGVANAVMANYEANPTSNISDLNLIDGEEYIIYIRVSDREVNGESNKAYFSTGKFHYGSTAPEITIIGDGYGTKFCAEATISVTDDLEGFTTTIDGEEITLTNGKCTVSEVGVHVISVVDKNGNKATKTFEIKGGHTYRNYTVAATCEVAGSRYDLCTVCGAKANETAIAAIGHNFTTFREKDPTCVEDGYRIYTCANGCGETLSIKWNSSETDLAQAKKLEENSDNEWVSITAADVKHLEATGEHTYAKVQDEDGKDTATDAWIIDKEATCSATGSKHKDCTKCGARVTEVIPINPEAHKYYRAQTAQEPTCTEEGWKNQVCRYDATHVAEKVEMIPALGHTEGEYRIIKAATCEEAGEKVLTCSVCNIDIGEAGKDGKYAENPVTVEIPALGHKWVVDGDPYQREGAEDKWYQNYKCANGCDETKTEETEYEEKVEATVTFNNGDNDADPQVITKYVGESISATDVIAPTKDADDTYKYTFRAWAIKNADGSYTDVNYPIEVKGDATYYARYDEKYINYTITYYAEDGTQIGKEGYLHNGDEVKLANGPKKAQTAIETYEFAGWEVIGSDPKVVYSEKLAIDGANINLKATFKAAKRIYSVTYAITMSEIIQTTAVTAGEAAPEFLGMDAEGNDPTKKHDTGYHYEFTGWDKAEQMKKVESNIYTTPVFEKAEHSFTVSVKSEATCTQNRVEIKECDNCDYSYEYEVPNTKLDHLFDENIFETDEQGNKVYKCQREGCDAIKTEEDTYTVNFYKEDGTTVHAQRFDIKWGASLSEIIKSVNAPEKAKDNEYIYTFDCWKIKNSDGTYADIAGATVKADMNLVATFKKVDRLYTVIFAYDASNVISHVTGKKYSEIGTALYNGATPEKAYEESATGNHYEFSNTWKLNSIDTKNDVYIYYAQFNAIKHSFTSSGRVEANCQHGASEVMGCVCGYSYTVESGKPLDHTYEVIENIPATPEKPGKKTYKCSVCGDTYSEDIKYNDPTEGFVTITVTVRNNKGSLVQGAKVDLYKLNGSQVGDYVGAAYTNSNGVATFSVEKGTYHVIISGIKNADNVSFNTTANGDGEVSGVPTIIIKDCSCACHNDNLWGKIFRFFHTIIKWITGEFKCCKDPSALY